MSVTQEHLKAQVEAAVMARGGKKQGAEIVFPCPNESAHKHGDAHPSANYNPTKHAWICRACNESGNWWHLGTLLGVINNNHRSDGWKQTRQWNIGGKATHKRLDKDGERKQVVWEKDGKNGLGGLPLEALPLYAAELVTDTNTDIPVSEGEKATDPLLALGFTAVGTVTGAAGTPSKESLKPLADHRGRVFLCQDNDDAGRDHMARVAARLLSMGKRVYILTWPGVPEKGDAYDYVQAGHTTEDIQAVLDAAPLYDGEAEPSILPEIIVTGRQLKEKTADALGAIIANNNPPRIFRHGGELTRVETTENGQPIIKALKESAIRGELARAAAWYGFDSKGNKNHTAPPLDVVRDFATLEAWAGIPAILSITESPVIRPDGSILDTRGYDVATRIYYYPAKNVELPPIPPQPTLDDVTRARELLQEIFCDFPFDTDISRANVLAALISPVVRPLVTGPTPLCCIDKPQVGSGASLIATSIATITTGRPAAMMTAPRDTDEWRKTITSALMQGRAVVVLDNLEGSLYDSNLAAVLTATTYAARILGSNTIQDVPNLATWIATGNNIRLGGDLPRRAYLVRIDAGVARPWLRDTGVFKHPELESWCANNRPIILAAILTLARAWIVAGRPQPKEIPRLGGYESWVRVVGGILAHAGIIGFLGNLMELYDRNDSETPAWTAFVSTWYELLGSIDITVAELIKHISENKEFEATLPIDPPHRDKKTGVIDDTGITRRLGNALSARAGRIYPGDKQGDYKLTRSDKEEHHAKLWSVKKGEFSPVNSPTPEAKGELGEFEHTPPTCGKNGKNIESNIGGAEKSPNSPTERDLSVDSKLPQNSPTCHYCKGTDLVKQPDGSLYCPKCFNTTEVNQ